MNQILSFTYEANTNIHTTTEDGTPFFCANDVATTLGYTDPKDALARHCRGIVKHYSVTDGLGRAIETAEGDLTPSAFGKILSKTHKNMGPYKFCRWLLDNNFAFRNGQGKIIPMQDAVNRGILILTERIDPAGKIRPQLLVTPAGQTYFANILSA